MARITERSSIQLTLACSFFGILVYAAVYASNVSAKSDSAHKLALENTARILVLDEKRQEAEKDLIRFEGKLDAILERIK